MCCCTGVDVFDVFTGRRAVVGVAFFRAIVCCMMGFSTEEPPHFFGESIVLPNLTAVRATLAPGIARRSVWSKSSFEQGMGALNFG